MVSFRNSQFRAILLGLVMADGISQGQLSWLTPGALARVGAQHWKAVDLTNDDWCHAIATQLEQLSESGRQIVESPSITAIASHQATLADLLATLPTLLWQLDRPVMPLQGETPIDTPPLTAIFHSCLHACLRQDAPALVSLLQLLSRERASPGLSGWCGLVQAIEAILSVSGDFQLAVGQSLRLATAVSDLPTLVGILSAAWGGLPSLPSRYQHGLSQPTPELQAWLQRRWLLSDSSQLHIWAEYLWQHWSGLSLVAQPRSPNLAVLPVPAPVISFLQ